MRALKICLVASEVLPYAKTGGLADVALGLPRALARAQHDVRVVMPMYRRVQAGAFEHSSVDGLQDLSLTLGARRFYFSVSAGFLPNSTAQIYFVRCPELYDREGIYTQDGDEHVRFAFLSQATLRLCQQLGWGPDVFHCNDWHTALLPLYLWTHYAWDKLFQRSRALLSIHNIGYQGIVGSDKLGELGLERERHLLHQDDLSAGKINLLKTGILYANAISTVSRTYAEEIQGPELGMGLEATLRQRKADLIGIVNGVDYEDWNPRTDRHLAHKYSERDLRGKQLCKRALLDRMGLPYDAVVPAIGVVSRLTLQKGFDLLPDILPVLLRKHDLRLTVLGSGEQRYEEYFGWLQRTFPARVAYDRGYKEDLSHQIEAGADLFLMPSRFEPCGLNQMYSLKYGTPPIVRRTGGLADTVEQWDPASRQGTGFFFGDFTPDALMNTIDFAVQCFRDQSAWQQLMANGMARDFSWDRQSIQYVQLYERLMPKP
jgi:starch synthase